MSEGKVRTKTAEPSWMKIPEPATRALRVYALDPSAGNVVGNVMTVKIRWERNLKPGPIGRRFAVVDYDGANKRYYPPVDLDDPRILARDGLDPSESDPRFHQQMVYAVASETAEKFEAALGRTIHWRRGERDASFSDGASKDVGGANAARADDALGKSPADDDIWVLKLYPHAMLQANAFYSRDAHGILFGYFRASGKGQGNNLPGQRVFTCLSHDIIAHEVTHAVIDGIRTYFTESTNPDVLAFHEAFADLTALFLHFSHKEALLDTIVKTGGQLYQFELTPDAAPVSGSTRSRPDASVRPLVSERNPLVELARQFGQSSGAAHALRMALDDEPDPEAQKKRVNDPHFRGAILVAAIFDAFFSTYLRTASELFRIYKSGGGQIVTAELPTALAHKLTEAAASTADKFFQLCARALDYCPPVDITFGDYLRALVTASLDLRADDDRGVRQSLMQAFRVRGIYPESASFFTEDALRWPRAPEWSRFEDPDYLPPVAAVISDPDTNVESEQGLVFGDGGTLAKRQQDINGRVLRKYALDNAGPLGFDKAAKEAPWAPSFHQVFRVGADGRLRIDMVVELIQTRRVPFDKDHPAAGTFPFRGGVTLIISSSDRSREGYPRVRYAIRKRLVGDGAQQREDRQRRHALGLGLLNGRTEDDAHFQVNFGLLHQGA